MQAAPASTLTTGDSLADRLLAPAAEAGPSSTLAVSAIGGLIAAAATAARGLTAADPFLASLGSLA
jgi:hypothetical protein